MSLILVAEPESRHVQRIRDALSPEGFRVLTVSGPEAAFAAARDEEPRLVLVSSQAPGAEELVRAFARRTGGPGVIALLSETEPVPEGDHPLPADRWLSKPFTEGDLRMAVRQAIAQPGDGAAPSAPSSAPAFAAPADDGQLTSEDIFGDLVAEVESEIAGDAPLVEPAPPGPEETAEDSVSNWTRPKSQGPRKSHELDQALEQTLSGLRRSDLGLPTKRPSLPDEDIDALLSDTLSGLELKRPPRRKKPAPSAADEATQQDVPRPAVTAPSVPLTPEVTPPTMPPVAAPPVLERAEPAGPAPVEVAGPSRVEPVEEPAPAAHSGQTPPATDDTTAWARRFGQYTLLERIAVGGMAEVWKARMTGVEGFQKTVAIKRVLSHLTDDEDFVNMLVDEAKLAAQLNHPNIVHIYDLGKIDDHFYIAMEYVDGMNLRGLLNQAALQNHSMPVGLAALVTSRLASALDYAHRKRDFDDREMGLVHRDVSPQNVLLSFDGDIKLCDFGIVKAVSKVGHTQMGALKGKLQYMSPEQAWGKDVDARSDVFSLGALFFEMLTGKRLFGGDSEISVLEAVRQCRVTAPRNLDPSLPEEVERIVLKSLEMDPDRRYQTAGEMQQDLDAFLHELRPAPGQADLAQMIEALGRSPWVAEPGRADEAPLTFHSHPTGLEAPAAATPEPTGDTEEDTARDETPPDESPTAVAPPAAPPVPEAPTGAAPDEDATGTRADEPIPDLPKSPSRRWLILAVVLLLLVAAAVTGYLLTRPDADAAPGDLAPIAADAPDDDATLPDAAREAPEPGEPPALLEDPETATAEPQGALDESLDLESMVDEALAEREERLRTDFERRQRDLERQIREARQTLEQPPAAEPPEPAPDGGP
jgi:serine/threonine protein kinase/CheY-like chemotaxis protein